MCDVERIQFLCPLLIGNAEYVHFLNVALSSRQQHFPQQSLSILSFNLSFAFSLQKIDETNGLSEGMLNCMLTLYRDNDPLMNRHLSAEGEKKR